MLGDRFEVMNAMDFPNFPEIEETGTTFLANARLKALGISRLIDGWVISDDSGLEVDALDGAPGVMSRRMSPAFTGISIDGSVHETAALMLQAIADSASAGQKRPG